MSSIERIIDEIETLIDNCKYQALSNTKIIVNKAELDELLAELKDKSPEEISRYQKLVGNREAILNDAKQKANAIIEAANQNKCQLVSEHQVMQQAYAQANDVVLKATDEARQILDNAKLESNEIKISAIQYTDELLENLQNIIGSALGTTKANYQQLIDSLQATYDTVNANRAELVPVVMGESLDSEMASQAADSAKRNKTAQEGSGKSEPEINIMN